MATRDTLWTCVGITKHVGAAGKEVVKVRCGVDLARRIKSSKSASYVKSKGEKLQEVRTDFIALPQPMLRPAALKFALTAPEFQSDEDQALIQDAIDSRMPKQPRAKRAPAKKAAKTVRVRASKASPSLDSIKARGRKKTATPEQILAAVSESVADTAADNDSVVA